MQLNLEFESAPTIADEFAPSERLVMLHADALEACRQLPDAFFSLIITSPPYNIGKSYEKQVTLDEYLGWQATIIEELARLLKPEGSICWQVGNYVDDGEVFPLDVYFYPIFKRLGLKLRNRVVWHFDHGLHASHRFSGRYETLLWFTKTDDYIFNLDSVRVPSKYPGKLHFKGEKRGLPSGNPLGKNPSDFWSFLADEWEQGIWEIPNVKSNHPEKTTHPCQFPVELVERCVLAMTNEGDWTLDPFAGVGSTLIAAAKNRRRALGIDRDEEYCALAKQRVADFYAGRLKLRPIGKPVHQPSGREKVTQTLLSGLRRKASRMIIAGVFSFNGGEEVVRASYPYLLAEVADVIASVDAEQHRTKISTEKTMMGRVLYSPSSLNRAFKQQFGLRDWHNRKVICDYPVDFYTNDYIVKKPTKVRSIPFRDMDFVKDKLGIEVQFGKYAFMVYNVCSKMTIFKNLDIIDAGIEIVPIKQFADQMSTGVSYFEQFVWDLQARGIADIDVPVLILGIDADS